MGHLFQPLRALIPGELVEILTDLTEPIEHAGCDGGFGSGSVALELGNHHRGHQEFQLALVLEHPNGDDPSLAISTFCQVEPDGSVYEESDHDPILRNSTAGWRVHHPDHHV
jgi:hypothetical protein